MRQMFSKNQLINLIKEEIKTENKVYDYQEWENIESIQILPTNITEIYANQEDYIFYYVSGYIFKKFEYFLIEQDTDNNKKYNIYHEYIINDNIYESDIMLLSCGITIDTENPEDPNNTYSKGVQFNAGESAITYFPGRIESIFAVKKY